MYLLAVLNLRRLAYDFHSLKRSSICAPEAVDVADALEGEVVARQVRAQPAAMRVLAKEDDESTAEAALSFS